MRHYLIVYCRSAGQIEELIAFPEDRGRDAIARRFEFEREHRSDPDIEVVVLSADSLDTLKLTHSRYFM